MRPKPLMPIRVDMGRSSEGSNHSSEPPLRQRKLCRVLLRIGLDFGGDEREQFRRERNDLARRVAGGAQLAEDRLGQNLEGLLTFVAGLHFLLYFPLHELSHDVPTLPTSVVGLRKHRTCQG